MQAIFDAIFSKIIVQSQINDRAAALIENCFKESQKYLIIPSYFQHKKKKLGVVKEYLLCTNCTFIKESKFCERCQILTDNNYYTLFDIKTQAESIVNNEKEKLVKCRDNLHQLGYSNESIIKKIHENNENIFTMTLNSDGVCIFKKRTNDTWPIFLVFNELTVPDKYAIQNIILVGLWSGRSKINNHVVLNDTMKHIKSFCNQGVEIDGTASKISVIYGSFDKPAKCMILNAASFNSTSGCMSCLEKCVRINRVPCYLGKGKRRTHGPLRLFIYDIDRDWEEQGN